MNRSTRAQPFTWNADGTPNFGVPVATGTTLPSPSGEPG
jgi:GH43 family beta-xylosidase